MRRLLLAVLATVIIAAPKPVPASPELEVGTADLTFGGTVTFEVTGLSQRQARDAMVDVQCYGSTTGGTDNVGWWDAKPYTEAFVLGSDGGVAPPDLGDAIVLSWAVLPELPMSCEARLWNAGKKGLTILDAVTFAA